MSVVPGVTRTRRPDDAPAPLDPPIRPGGRRGLGRSLLALLLAGVSLEGSIVAYRFLVHPFVETAFRLDPATSSLVRRVVIFAVTVLAYAAFVRLFERRSPTELAPRWRWTLVAGLAGAASIGVTILALFTTRHFEVVSVRAPGPAFGVLGVLAIAAFIEEVTFRGILFRILEESVGTKPALFASAVVFAVAHGANSGAGWLTFVVVTLAGLMWAEVYILSRNLWVTAAHHLCWNAAIFAIGLPLSGETDVRAVAPLQSVAHGSTLWTGGVFGPEDSLVNVVVMTVICLGLWRIARRRSVAPGGAPANEPGPSGTPRP